LEEKASGGSKTKRVQGPPTLTCSQKLTTKNNLTVGEKRWFVDAEKGTGGGASNGILLSKKENSPLRGRHRKVRKKVKKEKT